MRLLAGVGAGGDGLGFGGFEDADQDAGDFLHLGGAHAEGGQGRGAETQAGGVPGAVGVEGKGVAVEGDTGFADGGLSLAAGEAEGVDVEDAEVVIGAAGGDLATSLGEGGSESLGVLNDALGVVLEGRGVGFFEGDGFGGHAVGERSAEDEGAALVDPLDQGLFAEDEAAAGTAQSLVGGRGDDVGVRNRIELAGEDLTSDEAGEVSHVDHQDGADFIGDFFHDAEVDRAGVGGVAGEEDEGFDFEGLLADGGVVEQLGLGVDVVGVGFEHAGGDVGAVAVGEVAAGVDVEAEHALVAELLAQLFPVGISHLVDVLDRFGFHEGLLDFPAQDGPEGDHVGIGAGVRLDVGVFGAEELLGFIAGGGFDAVDVFAAGVVAVVRETFGIFVGEEVAEGALDGERAVVLGGDHFQVGALRFELVDDAGGDRLVDAADQFEVGEVGDHAGIDAETGGDFRLEVGIEDGHGGAPGWLRG